MCLVLTDDTRLAHPEQLEEVEGEIVESVLVTVRASKKKPKLIQTGKSLWPFSGIRGLLQDPGCFGPELGVEKKTVGNHFPPSHDNQHFLSCLPAFRRVGAQDPGQSLQSNQASCDCSRSHPRDLL